ncbi:inositol-3-phosphate synthase 1-A-like [Polypterus senegalus]|uniref:inositol-3-phosphate synthase 1-A-like n=1 Tax=Polypterus senegalus TaxID=55291 RepID=UPI00196366BB|nr:inositol-3-phosphate synthase 1-A-like [Polypterus senegalus]
MAELVHVDSPNVRYTDQFIESNYCYQMSRVTLEKGAYKVTPSSINFTFRTQRAVPKLGVMLVGWGGNNGTTVTAAVLANQLGLSWRTKNGMQHANYFGSLFQASTVCLGTGPNADVYVPFRDLLPMVHPNNIVFDGWDISSLNLAAAMERAQVLDWALQEQLRPHMEKLRPRASIYIPEFIAANQEERADNVLKGSMAQQVDSRMFIWMCLSHRKETYLYWDLNSCPSQDFLEFVCSVCACVWVCVYGWVPKVTINVY